MAKNIYFIDSRVADYQTLVSGLPADAEWVLINPLDDGIGQMQSYLAGKSGYDSLQIISHGSAGTLYLGSSILSGSNINNYSAQLAGIGQLLTDTGDILLYGCNIAAADVGAQFIGSLAQATGADVAASVDLTGAAALGGDWQLEATSGFVENSSLAVNSYSKTLPTSTFASGGGIVTTAIGTGNDYGQDVVVLADGRILVAGYGLVGANNDFVLVRYNTDGSLDTTFDGDGIVTTDFSGTDSATSVALQADGQILVAGAASSGAVVALARYNVNGSLDTSFSLDGKVTTNITGSFDIGNDLVVQSNGKILVSGWSSVNGDDFSLSRYNADGTLDTSFSGDGMLTTDFGGWDTGYSVALQPDGRILVSGHNAQNFALARYDASGNLDATFGSGGKVTTNFGGQDYGTSPIVLADGKILLAGSVKGPSFDFGLVRYNVDGSLDTSFGIGGMVTTDFGGGIDSVGLHSITLQADGQILVAGASTVGTNANIAIARYNAADGSLDTSFSTDGKLTTAIGAGNDVAGGIAVLADGKILVSGYSVNASGNADFALVRYSADGSLDNSVSTSDTIAPTVTAFSPADEAAGVAVDSNIVVTFDEAIQAGSGSIILKTAADTTIATYYPVLGGYVSISGNTLTINPLDDLAAYSGYKLEFAPGAVEDVSGNSYAGTTAYNFTTALTPVETTPNNLLVEAVNLAARAYSDAHLGSEKVSSVNNEIQYWTPLSPVDLGYSANDAHFQLYGDNNLLRYDNGNASATVGLTVMLDGKRTLGIAFEGTNTTKDMNSVWDIEQDIVNINANYNLLDSFVDKIADYAKGNQIDQVLVSGHSLGGAVAQKFMLEFGQASNKYIGVTFGSPGSADSSLSPQIKLVNFYHTDDPVPYLGDVRQYVNYGTEVTVTVDNPGISPINEHNVWSSSGLSYRSTIDLLTGPGNLPVDFFSRTKETHIVAGTENGENLSSALWGGSTQYFIAGAGNDTIDCGGDFNYIYPGEGNDTIKGGWSIDSVKYSGAASGYTWTLTPATIFTKGYYTVTDNDYSNGNNGTDKLYGINHLIFDDSTVDIWKAADGYISGAAIYIDANRNGIADPSENTGIITDSQGDFSITSTSDPIIAMGGTNIDTGLPNTLLLTAPAGSAVVSPLTTLIQAYAIQHAVDGAVAETAVQTALGIVANVDLTSFDPLAQGHDDAAAVEVQRANSQVAELGNIAQADGANFGNVANAIATAIEAGQTVDLANSDSLQQVVGGVVSSQVIEQVASVNAVIADATILSEIADIQSAQGNGGAILSGDDGRNTLDGSVNPDVLYGLGGNDVLSGDASADLIDGGTGGDKMTGGAGDDTYVVDNKGDKIVEKQDGGADEVRTSIAKYTLGKFVENLTLTGNGNLNGTGNELINVLTGNAGNNLLDGGKGIDTYIGGLGNDTYMIDDLLETGTIEYGGEGTDTVNLKVNSAGSYTLADNVEYLVFSGSGQIDVTGNVEDNQITGNTKGNMLTGLDGNDTLNGGAGIDTLIGGDGDDTYIVDKATDVVTELAGEGADDTVISNSSLYVLSDTSEVENLTIGKGAGKGTGNALDNTLTGNDSVNTLDGAAGNDILNGGKGADKLLGGEGADTLNGGLGNDKLTGNAGADIFVFNELLKGNVDTITDFTTGEDTLQLDTTLVFTNAILAADADGVLDAANFRADDSLAHLKAAQEADDIILYDNTAGVLYYDADGNGADFAPVKFATLTKIVGIAPTIDAGDVALV